MPAAADFHDPVSAGKSFGQHNGIHGGQGTTGGEPDFIPGNTAQDELCQFTLVCAGKPGNEAFFRRNGRLQGIQDDLWVMPQYIGKMALPEVNIRVAVQVGDL